jgi:bifunctional ADP-heptose synthase (sugar kinase/adenylyltransferase)
MDRIKEPQRIKEFFWIRERPSDELEWIRAEACTAEGWPRPLVLVSGAFDILHCGHMRLLFAAREKAGRGTVLCAMDSDRKVREYSGPGRPILNWVERSASLNYMPINYLVEVDTHKELDSLIERVRPDMVIEGTGHPEIPTIYPWLRKAYIRASGIHTAELIHRCVEGYEKMRYK